MKRLPFPFSPPLHPPFIYSHHYALCLRFAGNKEDGYLTGLDNLIDIFEEMLTQAADVTADVTPASPEVAAETPDWARAPAPAAAAASDSNERSDQPKFYVDT